MSSFFNVVLVHPEIPGNTGSMGRTCVALNLRLILIHPLGFDLSEKSARRAGLDYWKHVQLTEYMSWKEFLEKENPSQDQLFFFSKKGKKIYYEIPFQKNCYLVFGPETKGLSDQFLEDYEKNLYVLPMYSDKIRSLNLSNAATAVCYEGIRQINFNHLK